MIRHLTDNEKRAIANALEAYARSIDTRSECLIAEMSGNDENGGEREKLASTVLEKHKKLENLSSGYRNLGHYIGRSVVTIECSILFPEQL